MSDETSHIDNRRIKRVVVAGGGTAGWMAAAAISKMLGKVLDITLVESEEIGTVGVGEATIPTLLSFHQMLDIGEQDFMAAVQGTIKLGISFENWLDIGHHYIHSFGFSGRDHRTAGFQHFWLRGRKEGIASGYEDYCFELKAALADRFAHLPRGGINYAYHMDAALYAKYLRQMSERHGTRRVEGKIAQVLTDSETGCISALQMEDGTHIEGDFFVDCTGFRALLIGRALGVGFEDWSHWLLNDSALATQTSAVRDAVPYTRAIAWTAGWQWRIPLQHRIGNGYVYSSEHISDDEAASTLLANLDGAPRAAPRFLKFVTGRRKKFWNKNCVTLGLASGFLEPLESTSIHLVQSGLANFMTLFPDRTFSQTEIDQFNRVMEWEYERIRDFLVLHYNATERDDSPFWNYCRTMSIPDFLQHKLELFRARGRIFRENNELFNDTSWFAVMIGQNVNPRSYDPLVDVLSDDELRRRMTHIRDTIARSSEVMPTHREFIAQHCAAQSAV